MTQPKHPHSGQDSVLSIRGLLTAEEASALLSVPDTWVLAEARAERIPHVRLGRYVRFDAVELERWWRAKLRGAGNGPVPREAEAA